MSLRQQLQTLVFIDSFQNIDLWYQGYYFFKVRVYYEDTANNIRAFACPKIVPKEAPGVSYMGPKKTKESLHDQSRLPVMPVFSEDDSPRSTAQQSFVEQVSTENAPSRSRTSRSRTANKSERVAQNIPHTPPRIFSNNLNDYNKGLHDESPRPFNSRQHIAAPGTPSTLPSRRGECDRNHENCYRSKVFYIRYSDEHVKVSDIISFTSELDVFHRHKTPPRFFLEIQLFFKEATPTEIESQINVNMNIDESMLKKFAKVAEKKFQLNKMQKGSFVHYYPVQFTAGYFSCLQTLIHSTTTHFKFKPRTLFADVLTSGEARKQKDGTVFLLKAVKSENEMIVEPIEPSRHVCGAIGPLMKCQSLAELMFGQISQGKLKMSKVSHGQAKQLHKNYVQKLLDIRDQLEHALSFYMDQMNPGMRGLLQFAQEETSEDICSKDLLQILIQIESSRSERLQDQSSFQISQPITPLQQSQMQSNLNKTAQSKSSFISDTDSDKHQVHSRSMSPKLIHQSVTINRDRQKHLFGRPARTINKQPLNQTASGMQNHSLQQQMPKQREKSTPPKVSVSRSPIVKNERSFPKVDPIIKFNTSKISPINRELHIKSAHAAHMTAINALSQSQIQSRRGSGEQRSPARHIKFKMTKQRQNQEGQPSFSKAKEQSNVMILNGRVKTLKEKHSQLSQALMESRTDSRVINNGDLVVKKRPPLKPSTKAAVPSIIMAADKQNLDDLSITSEEGFPSNLPQRMLTARERIGSSALQFQEANNLSSIELRGQYIIKEPRNNDLHRTGPPTPKTNRSNLNLPSDVDYKTFNGLNQQVGKHRHEEEKKNFVVRQKQDQYKTQIMNQREENLLDENSVDSFQEESKHSFQRQRNQPPAFKYPKREDLSPQVNNKRHDEHFNRQTPAIFSKHSVISHDSGISGFLDASMSSSIFKANDNYSAASESMTHRKLDFQREAFFTENDVAVRDAKTSNKDISSMQLAGVSKRNHVASSFDAFKTCIVLERQIAGIAKQIQAILSRLNKVIQIDATSVIQVLQRQYLVHARKYYSQTIVEVYSNIRHLNDEDLGEAEGENVVIRQSIKDSGMSMMLHKHYTHKMHQESARLTPKQNNKFVHPFEEAKSSSQQQHPRHMTKNKSHVNIQSTIDRFSFGNQHADKPMETDRLFFHPEDRSKVQHTREEKKRSITLTKPGVNVALGARPLSPKQIEKSFEIAKTRRRDCSQVREVDETDQTLVTTQSDEDLIQATKTDLATKHRSKSQLPSQPHSYRPTQTLQTTIDNKELEKVTMPIMEVEEKESATRQFEPIIMEEVYYNENEPISAEPTTDVYSGIRETPRSGMSPSLKNLDLSTIVKDDMNSITKRKGGQGAAAIGQELTLMPTRINTPFEKQGPSFKQGLRDQQITDTEIDHFTDTISQFNVTSTASMADKIRREKFSQLQIIDTQNVHLFVLVHGFQATAADMRTIRNHLQTALPQAMFLISHANEKDTDSSIEVLGKRLANEVQEYIFMYLNGAKRANTSKRMFLGKLSFVAHSLGGLIVREALKHLSGFKAKMHAYISLGSPHLGYMYNSSSLIDAGMWLIKKWKQSDSLKQLSMTDASNKQDTFLFKLSQDDSLKHFKYVMLVSSFQDNYAPHDSARVQMCRKAAESDASKGHIYTRMVENILSSLKCRKLYRLDVNFKIENKNFASFIGRTAHILLIECEPFFLSIIYKYSEVFCE